MAPNNSVIMVLSSICMCMYTNSKYIMPETADMLGWEVVISKQRVDCPEVSAMTTAADSQWPAGTFVENCHCMVSTVGECQPPLDNYTQLSCVLNQVKKWAQL